MGEVSVVFQKNYEGRQSARAVALCLVLYAVPRGRAAIIAKRSRTIASWWSTAWAVSTWSARAYAKLRPLWTSTIASAFLSPAFVLACGFARRAFSLNDFDIIIFVMAGLC